MLFHCRISYYLLSAVFLGTALEILFFVKMYQSRSMRLIRRLSDKRMMTNACLVSNVPKRRYSAFINSQSRSDLSLAAPASLSPNLTCTRSVHERRQRITLIPGDGIGPEVMKQTKRLLDAMSLPIGELNNIMTVGTTFPSKNHHLKNGKEPCKLPYLTHLISLYFRPANQKFISRNSKVLLSGHSA